MGRSPAPRRHSAARVAAYYVDLTLEYEAYGGAARSWNYGVWEPDVRSHQMALERGKEVLVRGLPIDARTRVLDVGCGGGGFAIWCARTFGCHVTAITLCEEHVDAAAEHAAAAGVGDRCEFLSMDMDALSFGDASFDVVTNQESCCCSADKPRYLREVFRILRPGGSWAAIDFNVRAGALSAGEREGLRKVMAGFLLPSLLSIGDMVAHARAAGFTDCTGAELGPLVLPTASLLLRRSYEPLRRARHRPTDHLHSPDAREEAHIRGHFSAGMAYSVGLFTGLFEHGLFRARRPA